MNKKKFRWFKGKKFKQNNKKFDIESPKLGKDSKLQLLGWLLEFAYHHHRPSLLVAVTETMPEIQVLFSHPDKHLLQLHSFLVSFRSWGPLPELGRTSFLHSLHKALMDFMIVHPDIFYSVSRHDVAKFISALRWLLVASVASDKKFTTSDIKNFMNQLCPVLTESSSEWKNLCNILAIGKMDEDGFDPDPYLDLDQVRRNFNKSFLRTRSYWEKKIGTTDKLASEREKDNSPTLLKVFETVKETLWRIGGYISSLLPQTVLEQIQEGMEPVCSELKPLKFMLRNQTLNDEYLLWMLREISTDEVSKDENHNS